jgi:hypothetical protein
MKKLCHVWLWFFLICVCFLLFQGERDR